MKQRQKPDHLKKIAGGIFIVIAIALTVFAFIVQAEQRKEAELDRLDREKFSQLEMKMNDILADFKNISPESGWKLIRACDTANTPFPSEEGMMCSITIDGQFKKGNQDALSNSLKDNQFIFKAEGKDFSTTLRTYVLADNDDVNCTLSYVGEGGDTPGESSFYCYGPSRALYYSVAD
jgi:hypothetical protein